VSVSHPFAGRDAQLDELVHARSIAAAGTPACIAVQGKSGSGRAALIDRHLTVESPLSWALVHVGTTDQASASWLVQLATTSRTVATVDACGDASQVEQWLTTVSQELGDQLNDGPIPLVVLAKIDASVRVPDSWQVLQLDPLGEFEIAEVVAARFRRKPSPLLLLDLATATDRLPGSIHHRLDELSADGRLAADREVHLVNQRAMASDRSAAALAADGRQAASAGDWLAASRDFGEAERVANASLTSHDRAVLARESAQAAFFSNDNNLARSRAQAAVELARATAEPTTLAEALILAERCRNSDGKAGQPPTELIEVLGVLAHETHRPDDVLARGWAIVAERLLLGSKIDEARDAANHALAHAALTTSATSQSEATFAALATAVFDGDLVLSERLAADALGFPVQGMHRLWLLGPILTERLARGDIAGVLELGREFFELAEGRYWEYLLQFAPLVGQAAVMAGDWARVEHVTRTIATARARAENRLSMAPVIPFLRHQALVRMVDAAVLGVDADAPAGRGRTARLLSALERALSGTPLIVDDDLLRPPSPGRLSLHQIGGAIATIDLAAEIEAEGFDWEAALALLEHAHGGGVRTHHLWPTWTSRLAAQVCDRLGLVTDRNRWSEMAFAECTAAGAHLEASRTLADRGRWSCRGDLVERTEGFRLISIASARAERLGVPLYSRRWRAELDALVRRPSRPTYAGPALGAILFTDLADSTGINRAVGDQAWIELLAEHESQAVTHVEYFQGDLFSNTGDGFVAWFPDAISAIDCGLTLAASLAERNVTQELGQLQLRIAVTYGETERFLGRYQGLAVVRAARLCALGQVGRVLVGHEVPAAAPVRRLEFREYGQASLKGFDVSETVFEALFAPTTG
jgi:class 3 adenylate cyclase